MRSKHWNSLILFGLLFGSLKGSATEQAALPKGEVAASEKKSQESTPRQRTGRSAQENRQTFKTLQNLEKQLASDEDLRNQHITSAKPLAKPQNQRNSVYVGSDYILPYLRPGRNLGGSIKVTAKREDTMVPYPRLGKSWPGVESHEDTDSLMLPLARFGKSTNTPSNDVNLEGQFITPYPRIGKRNYHSSIFLPLYRFSRGSDFMTPYPRIGKRASSTSLSSNHFARSDEYLTPYPRLGKRNMEAYSRLAREEDSEYMTPYPRLGKRSSTEDIMIPYPRLGKKSSTEDIMIPYPRIGKRFNYATMLPYPRIGRGQQANVISSSEEAGSLYITPYLRPGKRSKEILMSRNMHSKLLDSLSDGTTGTLLPYMRMGRSENDTIDDDENPDTMIPSFRFGRSESSEDSHIRKKRSLESEHGNQVLLPYPRLGRSSDSGAHANQNPHISQNVKDDTDTNSNGIPHNADHSPYMLPYLRPGRSNQHLPLNSDESQYMIPYLRPGRSNQPSLPESDDSQYMLPYLRPGRSNQPSLPNSEDSQYMLPYLRPGRSNQPSPPDSDDSQYMLPYLRPGRSNQPSLPNSEDSQYMLPYLRPGRSNQPSPPDSDDSQYMLPYLRPGRSNQRLPLDSDDSQYILPYLRPGRSNQRLPLDSDDSEYMIPYLRPGRSNQSFSQDSEDSPYMIPYLRPGRSNQHSYSNHLGLKHFNEKSPVPHTNYDHEKESPSAEYYLLPYPRPGRSY